MSQQRPISICYSNTAKNIITPILMALVLLLTTINYFIYSNDSVSNRYQSNSSGSPIDNDTADNSSPNGPDEKAPNSPSSFSEEYVHESEQLSVVVFTLLDREHPTYCDELPLIHFKIFSPPPEC